MSDDKRSGGVGGSQDTSTRWPVPDPILGMTLTEFLRMRAAYKGCIKAGVEVDYCEHKVEQMDWWLRAYLADRA